MLICQVTLLQAARSPGRTDTFSFTVDGTVENVRVYITGRSVTFTLTSPTGNAAFMSYVFTLYKHHKFRLCVLFHYFKQRTNRSVKHGILFFNVKSKLWYNI